MLDHYQPLLSNLYKYTLTHLPPPCPYLCCLRDTELSSMSQKETRTLVTQKHPHLFTQPYIQQINASIFGSNRQVTIRPVGTEIYVERVDIKRKYRVYKMRFGEKRLHLNITQKI